MLYTKYRPQTFEDVKGQPTAIGLRNSVVSGRIPHSILLAGPRGTGKTSLSRIFSKAVNCSNLTEGEPCGKCKACLNPDYLEVDGSIYRSREDVGRMREYLFSMPRWNRRVLVIDESHGLAAAAQEALLKLLEEPPSKSIILMLTTRPEKMNDALKTRCTWWPIKMVPQEDILGVLSTVCRGEGIKIGKKAATLLARESEGSVRSALSLLEALVTYQCPITEKLVRDALSIINVDHFVDVILNEDYYGMFEESDRLCSLYSSSEVLRVLADRMMEMAFTRYEEGREGMGLDLVRKAAHYASNRNTKVVSDLAHLQVTVAESMDLAFVKLTHAETLTLWGKFLDVVETGIEVGFYPPEVLSETVMLADVEINEAKSEVVYTHLLGLEVSPSMVKTFNGFADNDFDWRKRKNDKTSGRRSKGGRQGAKSVSRGKKRVRRSEKCAGQGRNK